MDGSRYSISPHDIDARIDSDAAPIVADICAGSDLAKSDKLVVSARHRSPGEVQRWRKHVSLLFYCDDGQQDGQGLILALRPIGDNANFSEGDIADRTEKGFSTRRNLWPTPSKSVAWEYLKINDIAWPKADPALHRPRRKNHSRPERTDFRCGAASLALNGQSK